MFIILNLADADLKLNSNLTHSRSEQYTDLLKRQVVVYYEHRLRSYSLGCAIYCYPNKEYDCKSIKTSC